MTKEEFLKKVEEHRNRIQALREKIRKIRESRREKAVADADAEEVKSDAE